MLIPSLQIVLWNFCATKLCFFQKLKIRLTFVIVFVSTNQRPEFVKITETNVNKNSNLNLASNFQEFKKAPSKFEYSCY